MWKLSRCEKEPRKQGERSRFKKPRGYSGLTPSGTAALRAHTPARGCSALRAPRAAGLPWESCAPRCPSFRSRTAGNIDSPICSPSRHGTWAAAAAEASSGCRAKAPRAGVTCRADTNRASPSAQGEAVEGSGGLCPRGGTRDNPLLRSPLSSSGGPRSTALEGRPAAVARWKTLSQP